MPISENIRRHSRKRELLDRVPQTPEVKDKLDYRDMLHCSSIYCASSDSSADFSFQPLKRTRITGWTSSVKPKTCLRPTHGPSPYLILPKSICSTGKHAPTNQLKSRPRTALNLCLPTKNDQCWTILAIVGTGMLMSSTGPKSGCRKCG